MGLCRIYTPRAVLHLFACTAGRGAHARAGMHTCWHPCAFASPLQLVVEPSGAAGLAAVLADEWASACPGAAAAKWVNAGVPVIAAPVQPRMTL